MRLIGCAATGAGLTSTIFKTLSWVRRNARVLPAGAADLIGVEAGTATTVAEFLGVVALTMPPAMFLELLLAISLTAWAVFELYRCRQAAA